MEQKNLEVSLLSCRSNDHEGVNLDFKNSFVFSLWLIGILWFLGAINSLDEVVSPQAAIFLHLQPNSAHFFWTNNKLKTTNHRHRQVVVEHKNFVWIFTPKDLILIVLLLDTLKYVQRANFKVYYPQLKAQNAVKGICEEKQKSNRLKWI